MISDSDAPPLRGRVRSWGRGHGTRDGVLPIDQTSRRIVPELEDDGYDVTFVEFDGGHVRKPDIAERAVQWWLS